MAERILIVDDSMMAREMLTKQLAAIGYTDVCKAANGQDAMGQLLNAYESGRPFHIVLLDWNMPEMDGLDLLKKCRADPRFARLAIIMITVECEQQSIVKALEIGATSFLAKPFTPEAFEGKVKGVVQWLKSPGDRKRPDS